MLKEFPKCNVNIINIQDLICCKKAKDAVHVTSLCLALCVCVCVCVGGGGGGGGGLLTYLAVLVLTGVAVILGQQKGQVTLIFSCHSLSV